MHFSISIFKSKCITFFLNDKKTTKNLIFLGFFKCKALKRGFLDMSLGRILFLCSCARLLSCSAGEQ